MVAGVTAAGVTAWELTTVGDDVAVAHSIGEPQPQVRRWPELDPGSDHELEGLAFRTLDRPPGEPLATVCTVNDVHFGETECGVIEGMEAGPIFRSEPGDEPYPDVMNRGAIAEIVAVDPDAVLVKGDLTTHGTHEEFGMFLDRYEGAFGERLSYVRGNHDCTIGEEFAADAPFEVTLPGVVLAVLDTAIPYMATGQVSAEQLEWLDELGARADRPVLVFGHHHPWNPGSRQRPENYFGINPDDSERLIDVVARRPALRGYFAGHTHRNRVRHFGATGAVPWVEVSCVKDYPGAWAEYRVFEGGILQLVHRISAPEALEWSEKTRAMFAGTYHTYALGELKDRCFEVPGRG